MPTLPLRLVTKSQVQKDLAELHPWFAATGFKGESDSICLVPDGTGGIAQVLVGRSRTLDLWTLAKLPSTLPPHTYQLQGEFTVDEATALALGWRLGEYAFTRYKKDAATPTLATLELPPGTDEAYVEAATAATYLVRDLINTPANDMGPAELETAMATLGSPYGATVTAITGPQLQTENYPLIYAVGQASDRPPRLLDLHWGELDAPKITLVGKGVCFDSGGLDIKPSRGMLTMKKDMGGAAHVLGVALMIMALQLPVRLRVLIPAVENSISGNAMRPLDVLPSRRGLTVEVGNTDAEGRLVLADALWEACQDQPDLLVDFATLTGAARVALGSEVPVFFCNHPETTTALQTAAQRSHDPLWPLPLHAPYRELLTSKVADLSNVSSGSYGGAITAALFLQEFVRSQIPWVHIDVMAWNIRSLPGRPEGGEAMGLRAVFDLIHQFVQKNP